MKHFILKQEQIPENEHLVYYLCKNDLTNEKKSFHTFFKIFHENCFSVLYPLKAKIGYLPVTKRFE